LQTHRIERSLFSLNPSNIRTTIGKHIKWRGLSFNSIHPLYIQLLANTQNREESFFTQSIKHTYNYWRTHNMERTLFSFNPSTMHTTIGKHSRWRGLSFHSIHTTIGKRIYKIERTLFSLNLSTIHTTIGKHTGWRGLSFHSIHTTIGEHIMHLSTSSPTPGLRWGFVRLAQIQRPTGGIYIFMEFEIANIYLSI